MGYGFHGWDGPDHRERNRGYLEHSGYRVGSKREDQLSPSSEKRQKTSASH